MKRRALLAAAGTTAIGVAGCLRGSSGEPDGAEWSHDVGGRVLAVSDGRVVVQETFRDDAGDGSIVALDAASGERLWSYGSSNGYSTYTDPTVADALYFGYGDDAVGSGSGELYAVELDGAERWTVDTGSVYERPRFDDGTLYVGSDDGVVRAVDAAAGEVLWRHEVEREEAGGPPAPAVEAVADEVYVSADRLLALDPATGDVDWRFGSEDSSISNAAVHDGTVYVRDGYAVRAAENDEALWSESYESFPRVSVDDGRVFLRSGSGLLRLDPGDGSKRWSVNVDELSDWTVHGERVYTAGTDLYAFGADSGEERWSEPVADGLLDRVQVAAAGGSEDDHAVFVEREDEAIHRVAADGTVTWSEAVPGDVRSFVVDDRVYVGSAEGVFALAPE